jgi:hypothetical protein
MDDMNEDEKIIVKVPLDQDEKPILSGEGTLWGRTRTSDISSIQVTLVTSLKGSEDGEEEGDINEDNPREEEDGKMKTESWNEELKNNEEKTVTHNLKVSLTENCPRLNYRQNHQKRNKRAWKLWGKTMNFCRKIRNTTNSRSRNMPISQWRRIRRKGTTWCRRLSGGCALQYLRTRLLNRTLPSPNCDHIALTFREGTNKPKVGSEADKTVKMMIWKQLPCEYSSGVLWGSKMTGRQLVSPDTASQSTRGKLSKIWPTTLFRRKEYRVSTCPYAVREEQSPHGLMREK